MSGLVQFLIGIVALLAAGAIFMISIDKVAPDPFFARISKIAIGALLLIALIVSVAAAFGLAGGMTVSPIGLVYFAVAVIVAVVVLYVLNIVLDMAPKYIGEGTAWVGPVKYVLGAIVLIALLIVAATTLFGGSTLRGPSFWRADASAITAVAAAPAYMRPLLKQAIYKGKHIEHIGVIPPPRAFYL